MGGGGNDRTGQWPGSRVISAQKANTPDAFSLDSGSFSNGKSKVRAWRSPRRIFFRRQPGASLFGFEESNPVNSSVAYAGSPDSNSAAIDPMVGFRIGGVNVFGGGLALYGQGQVATRAIGVSGDTSCTDQMVAWRARYNLNLDHSPESAEFQATTRPNNIIYDIPANPNGGTGIRIGHRMCINTGTRPTHYKGRPILDRV